MSLSRRRDPGGWGRIAERQDAMASEHPPPVQKNEHTECDADPGPLTLADRDFERATEEQTHEKRRQKDHGPEGQKRVVRERTHDIELDQRAG